MDFLPCWWTLSFFLYARLFGNLRLFQPVRVIDIVASGCIPYRLQKCSLDLESFFISHQAVRPRGLKIRTRLNSIEEVWVIWLFLFLDIPSSCHCEATGKHCCHRANIGPDRCLIVWLTGMGIHLVPATIWEQFFLVLRLKVLSYVLDIRSVLWFW